MTEKSKSVGQKLSMVRLVIGVVLALLVLLPSIPTIYRAMTNPKADSWEEGSVPVKAPSSHASQRPITDKVMSYGSACDGGDTGACYELGVLYDLGRGTSKDPVRSAKYYQKACDKGAFPACINLAVQYDEGRGVAKDPARTASLYKKACSSNDKRARKDACFSLALMHAGGLGIPKDTTKAVSSYSRACDASHPVGCFKLAQHYDLAESASYDPEKAVRLYQAACKGSF